MLTLKVLNQTQTRAMYPWIKNNFPDDERRPLAMMLRLMRAGLYEVLGFYDGATPVGYALSILPKNNPTVLLDYLVVDDHLRGHGYGAVILSMLQEYYAPRADAILIESEHPSQAPDPQMAQRRVRFYQRSGAVELPFRVQLWGVDYTIFALPTHDSLPDGAWPETILDVYRQTLPPEFFQTKVRLIRQEASESSKR